MIFRFGAPSSQKLNHGLTKIAATVGTVLVVSVMAAATVITGGVAAVTLPFVLGTVGTTVLGAGVTAVAVSDIGEGIDSMEKAQSGDLNRGHNVIRDDLMDGNDQLYKIVGTIYLSMLWRKNTFHARGIRYLFKLWMGR